MSYRRAKAIKTKNHLEYCTYVVREDEEQDYRNAGVEDLLVIPHDAVSSDGGGVNEFMSTFYWIIQNTPEEVICIVDDDVNYFAYRTIDITSIDSKFFENPKEVVTTEMERIAQLLVDLDLGLACTTQLPTLWAYDKEFGFHGCPGGVRWVNKKQFKAKFDRRDLANSDVDMVMQELLMNRIVLMPKYIIDHSSDMGTNEGGTTRNTDELNEMYVALRNKWGVHFEYNRKKNSAHINIKR